jgi:hypothetical protein
MPSVKWSNGQEDTAATWEALEEVVRETQWRPYDADEFRSAMQKRAWRWSTTRINVEGDSHAFFRELEYAKLIIIVHQK